MKRNYEKIGNICTVIVIILSILILWGFTVGNAPVFWILAIFNLICGPLCLVLYLREVRHGVFADHED